MRTAVNLPKFKLKFKFFEARNVVSIETATLKDTSILFSNTVRFTGHTKQAPLVRPLRSHTHSKRVASSFALASNAQRPKSHGSDGSTGSASRAQPRTPHMNSLKRINVVRTRTLTAREDLVADSWGQR